jgi:hypothetical protein
MLPEVTVHQGAANDSLHLEIQNFYAGQMQALDAGAAQAWAATFTDDGVFAASGHPEPTRGRAALAAAALATSTDLAAQRIVRRHWLGMLTVLARPDDTVYARSYALVIATPKGGKPGLAFSTLCEDVLVRAAGGWLVRERVVTRDDL